MLNKEEFIVRFKLYHYNTGAGDNGFYKSEQTFDTLEKARLFKKRLDGYLGHVAEYVDRDEETFDSEYRNFVEKYIDDGYLDSVENSIIHRVTTEEKID